MAASPTKTFHKTTYSSLDPTLPEHSAKGKTIVITGGGTGIGAAAAKYFALAGASRIALLGRREQPLVDTKAALEASFKDTKFLTFATDVTRNSAVKALFEELASSGSLDVLCSNAAMLGVLGPITDLRTDKWLEGIVSNLQGNFNVTNAFLEHAPANAVIMETNSAAAHLDIASGFSSYNVSKMATARFYQCVQYENPGLSVFSFQPGAVATDMNRAAGYKAPEEGEEFERKGEGADLLSGHDDESLPASFMVWLASGQAEFLKGRFLWANWDVNELKARREEIESGNLLKIGMQGWPFAQV